LVGNGVHALQEAGVLSLSALAWPELPLLGLYASIETLGAQALAISGLLYSAFWLRHAAQPDDDAIVHA
jgi:high-affinity Fe2+/Pb2+ permease